MKNLMCSIIERSGLARKSSTAVVNGSSVENSSKAGNTVSLTANRKYKEMGQRGQVPVFQRLGVLSSEDRDVKKHKLEEKYGMKMTTEL